MADARPDWRASRRKRVEAATIAALGHPLVAVLGATWRWRVQGLEHYRSVVDGGRQPVFAFWHGRILPATYYFRHRGIVVMTSENFDGEWIARVIERFGFGTARGSTSRGSLRALVQMKREMAQGKPTAFTLDGPRGPARTAQPGAVWLAKATGNPLLPFHIEAARHWSARSWDEAQVPLPFTTVALALGDPIDVPADADDAALEGIRRGLEQALVGLERRAREILGARAS
jgi:lysophospholipid acyltransferase (LPLAT)-like uncharacterized protein